MRVDLGEDQWADLRELGELRRADQKAVLRSTTMEIDPAEGKAFINGAADEDQVDALMERIITNWSLPLPLPSQDPKSLGKLTMAQGDALADAAKPYLEAINVKVDPAKKGTDPTEG